MIRFQRPQLPPSAVIDNYLGLSREARWFSNGGPCSQLLAERLGERVGAFCTPVASGTLGLMAALTALLGDRTEGIALMPAFTFIATPQAAVWAGLRPLLLDSDPAHWHLDPAGLEATLAKGGEARVAIAVSAFGTPPPAAVRERWEAACQAAGVPLIVDSAAAFGAVADDGVPTGAQGDVEVVSFHATKPFAIGEGGAVFTRHRELHEQIERQINFGFWPDHLVASGRGLNAKMSELHAATALAVLDEYDSVLKRRRAAAADLRARVEAPVTWQRESERSTWQFAPLLFADEGRREQALANCADAVETRVYYRPVGQLIPDQVDVTEGGTPNAEDLHRRLLCLPMANDLSADEVATIATAVGA
ncbi:MAG: DegT/DnrJ/EryC1/StrS family aminotransferase [Actinobacteria bacterium]|nr:DegT/DnrJ/EryC1/StrS family aminotransferase [Actinomycetota bacterium]